MISLIVRTWKPDASEIIVYVTMLFTLKRIITAAVAIATQGQSTAQGGFYVETHEGPITVRLLLSTRKGLVIW